MAAKVLLIPTVLYEGHMETLPSYVKDAIRQCQAIFAENERTARRFLKSLMKDIIIDDFIWHHMKDESKMLEDFSDCIERQLTIGIISEAGCPGIADPGQRLVEAAHRSNIHVIPLAGPSSVLLALMASGMNGQHFRFSGYLPIEQGKRTAAIRQLEEESLHRNCTQIFIETPYRNNQLLQALLKTCRPATRICIAADLTAATEMIITRTVAEWRSSIPELHKRPVIFLLYADRPDSMVR